MKFENINCILSDDDVWHSLLPLTFTRPVAEIRIGIMTIKEKWEEFTGTAFSWQSQNYLREKFPLRTSSLNLLVNSSVLPNKELVDEIRSLKKGEALKSGSVCIAAYLDEERAEKGLPSAAVTGKEAVSGFTRITRLWHIFQLNGAEMKSDFDIITGGRSSAPFSKNNNIICPENVFAEENVKMEYCTLNASAGPIYLGRDTEIMEGSLIRSPFALCEGSQVKMGAKIYGPTTIGPHSKAGGEINNTVIFSNSNKVHDGYLGNAVLGEWCNIGADTNASNLKNNYGNIKIWNYALSSFEDSGQQFCGLIMGDYSRCGINTMFNTGTVAGICSNIYGAGYPRTFIPSFSKGGPSGFRLNKMAEVLDSIDKAMNRRDRSLDDTDRRILTYIHDILDNYEKWTTT
jgi:UDP-N-acetylglucosamine diphosphorylase/glucosamine-1-phosphate N-acetyltransferase